MTRITDVARAAGVSPATVSRVLNWPDLVARDKRDRVEAAIRELDYTPNTLAHSLRAGAVKTVALLVGDISQPFHGAFAKSMDRVAERHGYRLLLRDLDHNLDRVHKTLSELRTSDTYGVVLATADDLGGAETRAEIAAAQQRGLVVVSSSQVIDATIPAIVPRYQAISHLATLHLVTSGAWPIVFVGGSYDSPLSRDRLKGFERASAELGHDDAAKWVVDGHFAVEESRREMEALLDGDLAPLTGRQRLGVIAVNIRMAIGAMQAVTDRGFRVPEDVAVVCCEDIPLAAEWRPQITTVGIDFDALAEATFASVLAGSDAEPVTFLPHRITVRESSRFAGSTAEPEQA